jgi:hypothetical protein
MTAEQIFTTVCAAENEASRALINARETVSFLEVALMRAKEAEKQARAAHESALAVMRALDPSRKED